LLISGASRLTRCVIRIVGNALSEGRLAYEKGESVSISRAVWRSAVGTDARIRESFLVARFAIVEPPQIS
jgi:hypothetical protein